MLDFIITNWFGIVSASLLAVIVAVVWHSPLVLGKVWQKEAGIKSKDIKSISVTNYLIALLMILLTAIVLKRFLVITNPQTLFEAIRLSIWIWAGFMVTYAVVGGIFEKVSKKLVVIDLAGQILILITMISVLYYN